MSLFHSHTYIQDVWNLSQITSWSKLIWHHDTTVWRTHCTQIIPFLYTAQNKTPHTMSSILDCPSALATDNREMHLMAVSPPGHGCQLSYCMRTPLWFNRSLRNNLLPYHRFVDTHLIPRESVKGDDSHCVYNVLLQEQKILLVQRQIIQGVQTEIKRNVKQ